MDGCPPDSDSGEPREGVRCTGVLDRAKQRERGSVKRQRSGYGLRVGWSIYTVN